MLRRNLRHTLRYPSMTVMLAIAPIIFLLLFVYVFGGTLGAGLGAGGRAGYLTYVVPGILMATIAGAVTATSVSVATDMTEGIVARFRTMAISRASVLTGHVLGSVIQTAVGLLIVLGAALALGLRPGAGPLGWLGVAGVLVMTSFALTWLAVTLGMLGRTVEEASNTPAPLLLLPFLGSGFVPTDSMPAGLRQFAEYQPFTPIMETLRSLLAGTRVDGGSALAAVGWCAAIALAGFLCSRRLYNR
jgi:ABC-2 type transport system permease protein